MANDFSVAVGNGFTALATALKTLRTNVGDLASLPTTTKTSIVASIQELKTLVDAAASSGGAQNLDQLTDVAVSAPAVGHVLRHNGTSFTNVLGTDHFEPAGAVAAAASSYQPVDGDLTAIAALTTTAYGRALLALANQAGLMALLSAATTSANGTVRLATTAEATTGTDTTKAVTAAGVSAAINSLVAGAPGLLNTLDELAAALGDDPNFATTITTALAGKQPMDATLTALAAQVTDANKIIYATGADTFAVADLTPFARSLLDDADAATARNTLVVYSKTEIGDINTDYAALVTAALA